MISQELYEKITDKYGHVASWAIWDLAGDKPKSNMGNMDIFDSKSHESLLHILNTSIVMVGLNFSRDVKFEKPFMNFHDSNPHANDFKIRYAFNDTKFYGAYMTDVIKNLAMTSSKDVLKYLKTNPQIIEENINSFREELRFIESGKPIILAFGSDAYEILQRNLMVDEYLHLVKLTHYSHQISKDNYKKEVYSQLYSALGFIPSKTEFFLKAERDMLNYISIINSFDNIKKSEEASALIRAKSATKKLYELLSNIEVLNKA